MTDDLSRQALEARIEAVLAGAVRPGRDEADRAAGFALLRDLVAFAAERSPAYANYVRHWPIPLAEARTIADLPYLPVASFKSDPPLSLVPQGETARILASSATTGTVPSRIVVDAPTARRMSRGTAAIAGTVIGPHRRPYLVVDDPKSNAAGLDLSARGAAIRGLLPFATKTVSCLVGQSDGSFEIDRAALDRFVEQHGGGPVLIYGFTYILWSAFIRPLAEAGVRLDLGDAFVMHSGGWKKLLSQSVDKQTFNETAASVLGCAPERIVDFYGMVENVGVIYPDCPAGNKHAPGFGGVVIRDPATLAPVGAGGTGIIQVMSMLPTSFPGHLLLTEDLGTVLHEDGCPCGWPGIAFRFSGRVPKAELRGCGDVAAQRQTELAA